MTTTGAAAGRPGSLDTQPYWDGCAAGRLLYQRCGNCREVVFHPRALCPYCLQDRLEWAESRGRGAVYSFTVQHVPLRADAQAWKPRVLGIIALAEGFHMFAEILPAANAAVRIGDAVHVEFATVPSGATLPKFRVVAP